MAVYFEPRSRHWSEYVAPVVGQLLGGVVDNQFAKSREARAMKNANEMADKDALRKQQESDRVLNLLGYQQGTLDMRGDPNGSMHQLAAIQHLVPNLPMQAALGSLNPNMQFQNIDRGDTITAGGFDPGTGAFDSQDYAVGVNPTQRHVSDNALAGTKYASDANTRVARINAGARNARPRQAPKLIQDANGQWIWADAENQATNPTGIIGPNPAPQKGNGKPTLKDLTEGQKGLYRFDGEVVPGMERLVPMFTNAISRELMGGSPDETQPHQNVVDQEVAKLMGDLGDNPNDSTWWNPFSWNWGGGGGSPAQAAPINGLPANQLSGQPEDVIPGTDISMEDPRVKQAIELGYTMEQIQAYFQGAGQ